MTRAQVGTLGAVGAILGLGAYGLLGAGTTPIGTASELAAWPQGRADAPLCIYGRVNDGGLTCVELLGTQDGGDIGPAALWKQISAFSMAPSSWPAGVQALQPVGNGDFSIGECEMYSDGGGGKCIATQYGQGLGTIGMEIVDSTPIYPDAGFGPVQTHLFWDEPNGEFTSSAPWYFSAAVNALGSDFAILSADRTRTGALLYPDSDFSSSNMRSPGLIIEENTFGGGTEKARLAAVDGFSHLFYVSQNIRDVSGDSYHDADATAQSMNGWSEVYDAYGAGTNSTACVSLLGYPPGAGILAASSTFKRCLDGNQSASGVVTGANGLLPGSTLKTCTVSTLDATHVPENTEVGVPRAAGVPSKRCICINTSGTPAWGSITLTAGALVLVTAGGSATVCP